MAQQPSSFKLAVPGSTRTCWQIRVGRKHLVEILFCVRHKDFAWMRQNFDPTIQSELKDMLQESILPRVFGKNIEEHYHSEEPHEFPPQMLGARNHNPNNKKRRRSKKPPPPPPAEKAPKDVYYAFGTMIQVAYRREKVRTLKNATSGNRLSNARTLNKFADHGGDVTIFFAKQQHHQTETETNNKSSSEPGKAKSSTSSEVSSSSSFVQYRHFPERIVLWCQPNQDVIDTTAGGFYRPEFLPLASLFHESVRNSNAAAEEDGVDADD